MTADVTEPRRLPRFSLRSLILFVALGGSTRPGRPVVCARGLPQEVDTNEEGVEKLAREVMEALAEARQSLASVSTPAQMNEFMQKYVGPMIVRRDGSIGPQKKSGSPDRTDEPDVPGLVAGARSEVQKNKPGVRIITAQFPRTDASRQSRTG